MARSRNRMHVADRLYLRSRQGVILASITRGGSARAWTAAVHVAPAAGWQGSGHGRHGWLFADLHDARACCERLAALSRDLDGARWECRGRKAYAARPEWELAWVEQKLASDTGRRA